MKKSLLTLAVFLTALSNLVNAAPHKPLDKVNVWLVEGAELKDAANEKAKTIAKVPYGTALNIVKETTLAKAAAVDFNSDVLKKPYKLRGTWVKVNYNGKQGYIFDGYLSAMPALNKDKKGYFEQQDNYMKRNFGVLKIEKTIPKKDATVTTTYYKNGAVNKETAYDGCFDHELILKNISYAEALLLQKVLYKDADAAEGVKVSTQKDGSIKISSYDCD